MKTTITLRLRRAHRLEDADVAALLHDQQDERRDDVERGDRHDQADGDRDDHLLEPQRREERPVHVGPVLHPVVGAERRGNAIGNRRRLVGVEHLHLDQVGRLVHQPLGDRDRDETRRGVVVVQAKAEDARDAEPARARHPSHRRERALRA